MPASLNLAPTQDNYTDTLTVVFTNFRPAFTLQVVRASIYYKLLFIARTARDPQDYREAFDERMSGPVSNMFTDPQREGGYPGELFAGIKVRSYTPNAPALVNVH